MIKLQETPESIPEGETPHTIQMFAFDELCEISRPGDKVEVTGIFRAIPLKVNPRLSSLIPRKGLPGLPDAVARLTSRGCGDQSVHPRGPHGDGWRWQRRACQNV